MKRFLRPKHIFPLVLIVMLASAIIIPLSGNTFHAHAQGAFALSFTKTAAATVKPGGTLNYTLTLTNTSAVGTELIHDLHVTDPLPSQLSAITTAPTLTITPTTGGFGDCSGTSGLTVSCTIDNFDPGAVATITFSATVSSTATGTITNTSTAVSQTTPVSATATATTVITAPGPHKQLIVLLQGIDSNLSKMDAAKNNNMGMVDAFWASLRVGPRGAFKIPAIVTFLQSNGFSGAQYLVYSYLDSKSNGNPTPYDCTNTFTSPIPGTNPIAAYAMRLGKQINAALTHNPALIGKPTDVYLIAHSLGGVVALSYLTALYKTTGVVPALPAGDTLKGVITLDSPIGGVSADPAYLDFIAFVYKGCVSRKQLTSVTNLVDIFKTTSKGTFPPTDDGNPGSQGAHASILKAIFGGPPETNQGVVEEAFAHGTSVLTIGNYIDFTWNPAPCQGRLPGIPPIPRVTFLGTQWIGDEGPADATKEHKTPLDVYGRAFTAGDLPCFLETTGFIHTANHLFVLNNTDVESALKQFLPNGGVPKALDVATPEP